MAQFPACAAIASAAFGMCLRVLIDKRLNALLLIAREIELTETARPLILNLRLTGGGRAALCVRCRRLILLRNRAERQCEHCRKCADGQKVCLHPSDSSGSTPDGPERRIRT